MKRPTLKQPHKVLDPKAYDQLDRVRNVISNAELAPLANEADQAAVLYHLKEARAIYRCAWDGGK